MNKNSPSTYLETNLTEKLNKSSEIIEKEAKKGKIKDKPKVEIKHKKLPDSDKSIIRIEHTIKDTSRSIKIQHSAKNNSSKYKIEHRPKSSNQRIKIEHSKNKPKELSSIVEEIKRVNWRKLSDNWIINTQNKEKLLNPNCIPSVNNPVYRNKTWLKYVYNHPEWNLNDRKIAKICNVNPSVIGKWRKKHGIPKKELAKEKFIVRRGTRTEIYIKTPKDYEHPELKKYMNKPIKYRLEHIYKMEKYLSRHPNLEISKKCLINKKYLKIGTEVHHINQNSLDNNIWNLWVYENKNKHAIGEKTLKTTLQRLIKIDKIQFKDSKYVVNNEKPINKDEIKKILKSQQNAMSLNFKNISRVKDAIKKIEWDKVSKEWTVKQKVNQFKERNITLDPLIDCSDKNPLYRHKLWMKKVIDDNRFNLTDSRLAILCGITRDKARFQNLMKIQLLEKLIIIGD